MAVRNTNEIKSSEITDKQVYINRRLFIRGAALAATMATTGLLYRKLNPSPFETPKGASLTDIARANSEEAARNGFVVNENLTPLEAITNYNNFYEFSTGKGSVAAAAKDFVTRPWSVSVDGLVNKPRTFDLDELLKFPSEERIYRLRCVEGWSMVIPWVGFPLAKLLDLVEPTAQAKYVAFQTLFDPERMPNQNTGVLDWPYVEGLRLDEAMHPLTILATGLYDETLPPQMVPQFDSWCRGVWLQEHQIGVKISRLLMSHHNLEPAGPKRVRILFKRKSERLAPPVESGERATDWRVSHARHANVQRIWRSVGALYAGMDLKQNF